MPPQRADLGLLDDRDLLSRHAAGEADAFGELFRRHRDRLWSVALRTLGDPEEAADALQDAMVSAYRAAGSFRGDAAVTTWLHRVVVNACLDRIRRRNSRPTVPLPEVETESQRPPATDDIANTDLRLALASALATLSEEQRVALILVDVEGYTVEEAARALGVAAGTIKSRCARARARLLPLLRHLRESDTSGSSGNQSADSRVKVTTRQDRREGGMTAG
ncbi:MAG: RNA polymerase sigma factor SigM [Catenulisporales bacterium]|nr:RNA polymerase sigma factor SigM [Catenulisporales bacterium]